MVRPAQAPALVLAENGAEMSAELRRPTPWWRQGVITLTVTTVAVPLMFFAVMSTVASASAPDRADMPVLPEGLRVVRDTETCGSGGCAREWTIEGPPGASLEQIREMLDLTEETCRKNGLLDFEERCTGVTNVGGEMRLYVSVSEFLK